MTALSRVTLASAGLSCFYSANKRWSILCYIKCACSLSILTCVAFSVALWSSQWINDCIKECKVGLLTGTCVSSYVGGASDQDCCIAPSCSPHFYERRRRRPTCTESSPWWWVEEVAELSWLPSLWNTYHKHFTNSPSSTSISSKSHFTAGCSYFQLFCWLLAEDTIRNVLFTYSL